MMIEQAPEPGVGKRIRALREQRGLSLRALAEQSSLSINAISRMERGETSPTVSSLHSLATALNVPITDFFQHEPKASTVLVKHNQRVVYQQEGVQIESLGIGLRHQQLEPFIIVVQPSSGSDFVVHEGQELVFCLTGRITYYVGAETYHLTEGDSLLFEATQPHRFKNSSGQVARFLLVFQASGGSHLARQRHLQPT
jgi:transcriptional regulator with XRE-family HTH domain